MNSFAAVYVWSMGLERTLRAFPTASGVRELKSIAQLICKIKFPANLKASRRTAETAETAGKRSVDPDGLCQSLTSFLLCSRPRDGHAWPATPASPRTTCSVVLICTSSICTENMWSLSHLFILSIHLLIYSHLFILSIHLLIYSPGNLASLYQHAQVCTSLCEAAQGCARI